MHLQYPPEDAPIGRGLEGGGCCGCCCAVGCATEGYPLLMLALALPLLLPLPLLPPAGTAFIAALLKTTLPPL